jgi:transposase
MSDTIVPTFPTSYRVRLALEVSGVTEQQLAEYLQVHINTVYNYVAGRRRIRRATLMAIAQLTSVDFAWLEGDDSAVTGTPTHRYRPWVTHTASVSAGHHGVFHLHRGPPVSGIRSTRLAVA